MNSEHEAIKLFPNQLKVMAMYEDLATRNRIGLLLNRVSQNTNFGISLIQNRWMFALLGTPLLREQAALQAAAADIIILSVTGRSELTPNVQDWLTRWLLHKDYRPYAFGVLLDAYDEFSGTAGSLIETVRTIAQAGGVDFFCSGSEAVVGTADIIREINAQASPSSDVLEEILRLGR